MYISKIKIKNFRNFDNSGQIIEFVKGVNVLTGHNNAGKTNVIKALQLVFDRNNKTKLAIDDFNKEYSDFSIPPSIQIEITLQGEKVETENDKVIVFDWIENIDNEYEILRFCNKLNTQVISSVDKLLYYFMEIYRPESIITYVDRRYSQGSLYKELGFKFIENTEPNYWYFDKNEKVCHHHFKFNNNNYNCQNTLFYYYFLDFILFII